MATSPQSNVDWLRARFAAPLIAQAKSVLDVGCGAGAVLELLVEHDIPAFGVEFNEDLAHEVKARGLDVRHGEAANLPFQDGEFEWVALRHVLHHLDDPKAAVREAARVARRGLVLAEPWFDVEIPSQRIALEVDRWMKAQDRRLGMVHEENMNPAEIAALLPTEFTWSLAQERCLSLTKRPGEELDAASHKRLKDSAADSPERTSWSLLQSEARRHGVTCNGSAILVAEREDSL